ncbi:MAG: DUF4255 domain-containing protein [Candidatus Marinimicrobia bacterium]|nr:DUF4255 domain-containing protein [Candidatus Neomarinimicrobiota bacterium]MCF7880872.1 DUF4255 domain-containing protein [Candidatus Neomarinimicrobiota bacterium]
MLDKALEILRDELTAYLKRLPDLNITSETVVFLSNIVDDAGTVVIPDNALALTLVNIEEERILKSQESTSQGASGRVSYRNPEIKLNLYLLFTGNFQTYETGLKYLGGVVRFFQAKNVFLPENTPDMDPSLEKLVLEMHNLNFEQQNHLWGALGAKYLPSVLYELRLITIQEDATSMEEAPIKQVHFADRGMN